MLIVLPTTYIASHTSENAIPIGRESWPDTSNAVVCALLADPTSNGVGRSYWYTRPVAAPETNSLWPVSENATPVGVPSMPLILRSVTWPAVDTSNGVDRVY